MQINLLLIFRWCTRLYLYMSPFQSVHLSVHLFVCLLHTIFQEHKFWYARVKPWYFHTFFSFFKKILIFQVVMGVKGQKIAQNEKWQLHLSRAISQVEYSTWSWFLVNLCRMMKSPGVFSFFWNFIFFGLLRGTGGGG